MLNWRTLTTQELIALYAQVDPAPSMGTNEAAVPGPAAASSMAPSALSVLATRADSRSHRVIRPRTAGLIEAEVPLSFMTTPVSPARHWRAARSGPGRAGRRPRADAAALGSAVQDRDRRSSWRSRRAPGPRRAVSRQPRTRVRS